MMTPKRSVFLIITLAVLGWLLFSSLHPSIETYIIEGQVSVLDGSASQAKVYFTQEDTPPERFEVLNKAVVQSSGAFNTRFNAIPNKPAYLYVVKEGFTTVRSTVMLSGAGKKIELQKPLEISSLPYSKPYNEFTAANEQLEVVAYSDACLLHEKGRAGIDRIDFFDGFTLISNQCRSGQSRDTFRAKLWIDGKPSSFPSYISIVQVPAEDKPFLLGDRN